jgi:hypothetical protein
MAVYTQILTDPYLRFFYERFVVSNKTITEAIPTPIFKALLSNSVVRLRQAQLRGQDSDL